MNKGIKTFAGFILTVTRNLVTVIRYVNNEPKQNYKLYFVELIIK